MTCIIGLVSKDGCVFLGGDSAGIAGLNVTVRKDPKVFKVGNFVFGFTSSFRMGQLLQYSFTPPDHDPRVNVDKYIRTEWLNSVRKCFESGGYMRKNSEQEEGGCFLVGYQGRLYFIDSDFQIAESLDDYYSVGCGAEFAMGAMHALKNTELAPEEKIKVALHCAAHHSAGVRPPFLIEKT